MDLPSINRSTMRAAAPLCALVTLAAIFCAPGCRTFEPPADLASALPAAESVVSPKIKPAAVAIEEPSIPPEMASDAWVVALPQSGGPDEFPYHWQHAGLDRLLALPPREHPDFAQFLTCDNPIAAGNAMILLARAGDETVDRCLIETVRNTDLKLPMRRAAAEALSMLATPIAAPGLGELLDDFGNSDVDKPSAPLHAEVLRGLARHTDPSATPYFAAGLKSSQAEIREASLYAYTINTAGPLPAEAVELRSDSDPRVRAAALACLAARRHPQALEYSQAALTDFHLDVRLAAIEALGRLGGDEARATLQRMLIHDPEAVRSAAITALAAAGDEVTAFASAKDPSWQVRRSVARSLSRFPSPRGAVVARQLLADGSTEVRRAVLLSIDAWPLTDAGPILLTAMAEAPLPTRKQAAAELAARWSPAARFPADAPADVRSAEIAALRTDWESTHGPVEPPPRDVEVAGDPPRIAESALDPPAEAIADAAPPGDARTVLASHHEILAAADQAPEAPLPVDAAVRQLASVDVALRRAAARQLADASLAGRLDAENMARMCERGTSETDAGVWCELLRAVKSDTGDASLQLGIIGCTHPVADVRRLSCAYLGTRADPRSADVLLLAISDHHGAVVRAALEALAAPGALADPAPVEQLLAAEEKPLRIAAARTLAVNGFASGSAALIALAHDDDPEVRRQAAAAMGTLHDPAFLGTLVGLLDDDLKVRLAGITSLSLIVGRDVNVNTGSAPPPLADQVNGWKHWWEVEGNRVSERNQPGGASTR